MWPKRLNILQILWPVYIYFICDICICILVDYHNNNNFALCPCCGNPVETIDKVYIDGPFHLLIHRLTNFVWCFWKIFDLYSLIYQNVAKILFPTFEPHGYMACLSTTMATLPIYVCFIYGRNSSIAVVLFYSAGETQNI